MSVCPSTLKIYQSQAVGNILCQLLGCSCSSEVPLESLWHSIQDKIKNATSEEERENACIVLLCLLSGITNQTEFRHELISGLFNLSKDGFLNRRLLYSSLVARSELNTVSKFLDHERPYLRNEGSIHESLHLIHENTFMELFLITVRKQQHWLSFLLHKIMFFLRQEDHTQVQSLLSHPILQCLWPLLFLHLLHSDADASSLKLAAEHTIDFTETDPHVSGLAKKVLWYLNVTHWLKENNVVCQTFPEICSEATGTLGILNQCCDLSNLDWLRTHDFLAEYGLNGHAEKWEISLFDTFNVCTLAIDYVFTCLLSKHGQEVRQHEDKRSKHLKKLCAILCQLQPLSVRLKTMENIFSLLFLQYEDFREDLCSDSEEGEIDYNQSFQCENDETSSKVLNVMSSSMTSVSYVMDKGRKFQPKIKTSSANSVSPSAAENKNWCGYHQKHGFVCDRFMARDILKLLDSCLKSTRDADDIDLSEEEIKQMKCIFPDIDRTSVDNTLAALQEKVSVGLWKLEVLLGSDFIQQANIIEVATEKASVPNWIFQHCFDDDSASDEESTGMTASNIGLRRADTEKSSESGSQSNLAGHGQAQGLSSKSNRKGRRKSSVRHCARGTKDSTIKKMLSSNHSLVSQCLSRGNIEAAKDIVQALNLEDSEVSTEVNFIEAYQTLKNKVDASTEKSDKQFPQESSPKTEKSTLLAIQRAASAGVQASSLNKEVEKLLLHPHLPCVPDVEHLSKDFLNLLGGSPEDLPIMTAAVDVALILSSNIRQSASFLNTASKFSQDLLNFQLAASNRLRPIGFIPLIQNMLQASVAETLSPSELLLQWDVPNFTSRQLRDTLQFWDSLMKLTREFQASFNHVTLYPKFLQLLSCSPSLKGNDNKQECHYFQDFKSYLRLLKFCKDRSSGPLPDLPLTEEHFLLLQKSPYKVFAHMVCEESVSAHSLESLTSQLGCNLPHILSMELCYTLPSIPAAASHMHLISGGHQRGVQILNASDTNGPVQHPTKTVEMVLSIVLSELQHQHCLMEKLYQSQQGYLLASQINLKQLETILFSSWELRDVDLKLLQPGAETLVFFCNLSNLMWIHAMLYFSNLMLFGDNSLKSLIGGNSIQQLAAMNSIAYQVGNAGVLTLWEVRRLALGVHLMQPAGTRALQENAMVTDSFDPLTLFVVSTGSKFSPKLKVLYPENLEEQLQQSVQEYIDHWADVHLEEVTVPSLVKNYIKSTGQNIIMFLKNHMRVWQPDLTNISLENLRVSYFPDDFTPLIILDYSSKYSCEVFQPDVMDASWKSNPNLYNSILDYIKSHCPIVSFLLSGLLRECRSEEECESDEEAQEATEVSVTSSIHAPSLKQYPCLDRLCKMLDTVILSQVFDSNLLLCALHCMVPDQLLWKSINLLAEEQRWERIVELLKALPPLQLQNDCMLTVILDLALFELAIECRDSGRSWFCCEQMNSVYLQARCIIAESKYWPGEVCLAQLKRILQSPELKSYTLLYKKSTDLMRSIETYQMIKDIVTIAPWKSWQDVQTESQKHPDLILKQILYHQNAGVCVSWLNLHNVTVSHPYLIDSKVVVLLLNDNEDRLHDVEKILYSFPARKVATLCFDALEDLCRIPALQFCVNFMNLHCIDELDDANRRTLEIVTLGIQMVKAVPNFIQQECLGLVRCPHLMIEQLLMNVQLEAAEQMLNCVHPLLLKLSPKSPLSISALDSMLRQYAEKALEFHISQGSSGSQMSENNSLLTSLASHSPGRDSDMPPIVPSKAEWVPNEQAAVCMNCQISVFTMFNRRHHCRRCGRVVCSQCSPNKSLVHSYGTLKVRVCSSCYIQIAEGDSAQAFDQVTTTTTEYSTTLLPDNMWRLSCSASSNETVRGEFAYEHAPSVSLCLSILKLHSESAACPNFLIDSCETILSYLQPQGGIPNPEVDYGYVIDMCRSLVLAAKVKCAQWGYISDEPNCDQRLSKIDLLGLLVSHGCTSLIPNETTSHRLRMRRLQTHLVQAELWELALEVSMKSGMEKIGVWTSWGKGCLRAGRWKEAREKFAHCFPSSSRINKSAPDSPLLIDILQILENTPHSIDPDAACKTEALHSVNNRAARAPAVVVLNTLASLKNVSQGKFNKNQGGSGSLQPYVYSECCYYLREFGSHATYLQFLVRYDDFKAVVEYTLAFSVDPQIFFESAYMPCLRRGQITPLHSEMTAVDSSLAVWTSYMHGICAALERHKLLHTLYEVQQWSKDHVRAAMTCIRFYHLNAKSYLHLAVNINYLMQAQSHLEEALAVAIVSRKDTESGNDNTSNTASKREGPESMWLQLPPKEIDHHMSTVERQKELAKFLGAYESKGRTLYEAAQWFPHAYAEPLAHGLPTLFGSAADRKILAGLCLFCGKNVEEGYGIVYRIIEAFSLSASEIYEASAVALYRSGRAAEMAMLLDCIHSSGIPQPLVVCDSVIMACFQEMPHQPSATDIDLLVRSISDQALKIKAFIICGQLKSAYLLAVKYNRLGDIELILSEADRLGQNAMKKICLKRLGRI